MNELDGDWYEERNPITLAPNIDIPVWLQIDQGRGWTMDGTIELFNELKGPKKLDIGPYPPMQSRPFIEEHDKMFRWYDYWIKGIDNGVMDEPAVSVFVEGSREVVTADQWPPKEVGYRKLYLRPRHKLSTEPELMGAEYAAPGRLLPGAADRHGQGGDHQLVHACLRGGHGDDRHRRRAHLRRDRPAGHQLHPAAVGLRPQRQAAAHHQRLPEGLAPRAGRARPPRATRTTRTPARFRWSRGRSRSTCCASTPSPPPSGRATRLTVELSNNEPLADEHNALLPAGCLPPAGGRPVTHKVYRDAAHPSRLVLPFTTRN